MAFCYNVEDKAMRTIIALAGVFLSNPSLADTVRHPGVPERVWGTWAPSADLCRDDKSTVTVSAKSYVTGQENCEVRCGGNRRPQRADLFCPYALLKPRSA